MYGAYIYGAISAHKNARRVHLRCKNVRRLSYKNCGSGGSGCCYSATRLGRAANVVVYSSGTTSYAAQMPWPPPFCGCPPTIFFFRAAGLSPSGCMMLVSRLERNDPFGCCLSNKTVPCPSPPEPRCRSWMCRAPRACACCGRSAWLRQGSGEVDEKRTDTKCRS